MNSRYRLLGIVEMLFQPFEGNKINLLSQLYIENYIASSLRKLCFREKFFFRDISVKVLRIV